MADYVLLFDILQLSVAGLMADRLLLQISRTKYEVIDPQDKGILDRTLCFIQNARLGISHIENLTIGENTRSCINAYEIVKGALEYKQERILSLDEVDQELCRAEVQITKIIDNLRIDQPHQELLDLLEAISVFTFAKHDELIHYGF